MGEFDLLRHSHTDVQDREWARPAVREATTKFFKLCRAKEEIIRINVEMRRLRTAIHDEEKQISITIADLCQTDPLLGRELQRLHRSRAAINIIHLRRLDHIQKRYGCTVSRGIGVHLNSDPDMMHEHQNEDNALDTAEPQQFNMQDVPDPVDSKFRVLNATCLAVLILCRLVQ